MSSDGDRGSAASKRNRRATRPPAADEIERELRNAKHYLTQLALHEVAARKAYDASDLEAVQQAKDAFLRDLSACLNAARTAKNYLTSAIGAAGQRSWLDERLAPPTYKFHADLAGSVFHDGAIKMDRLLQVQIAIGRGNAKFEIVPSVDGSMELKPLTDNVTRAPLSFIYDPRDLGDALAIQLNAVDTQTRSIVDLAAEYLNGLEQTLKNAIRNSRMATSRPEGAQ